MALGIVIAPRIGIGIVNQLEKQWDVLVTFIMLKTKHMILHNIWNGKYLVDGQEIQILNCFHPDTLSKWHQLQF